MAATNPSARTSDDADVPESGVGMAHLTVVPENFEPTENEDK